MLWSVLFWSTASSSALSTPLASSLSRWERSLVVIVVVIIVVGVVFLIVVKVQKLNNVFVEHILFPAEGGARGGG